MMEFIYDDMNKTSQACIEGKQLTSGLFAEQFEFYVFDNDYNWNFKTSYLLTLNYM